MKKMEWKEVKNYLKKYEYEPLFYRNFLLFFSDDCKYTFFGLHGNDIYEIFWARDDIYHKKHALNVLKKIGQKKYNEEELKQKFINCYYKGIF